MKKSFKEIPGSIVASKGFLASGVFCDIKRLGTGKGSQKGKKRDLALIVSSIPAMQMPARANKVWPMRVKWFRSPSAL
jgi:hypothetical protein